MYPMFRFESIQRVTFDDLDPYNVVNNSRYFTYFERGRVDYLREIGLISGSAGDLEKIDVAVVENYCSYRSPAYFDNVLNVYLRISYIKRTSLQFQYIINRNEDKKLIALGYTNLVRVHFPELKPRSFDNDFKEKVRNYEKGNLGKMTGIPDVK